VIEKSSNGERFLLLEKAENLDDAKTGNYILWKEDNIAIPIDR